MIYLVAGKRILVHDREEWQVASRPVTGPAPYPDLVHHAVVHWPGASTNWKPPLDTASHLRWAQDSYLLDPNRGYSYGYGHVIGQNEIDWDADPIVFDTWEVRGFDIRIASNDGDNGWYGDVSNPNFNGRSWSQQLMASTLYPATDDQILQARYMVAIADQRYGETLTVIPHLTSDATSCPHPYITSKIPLIATRPVAPTPTPTPDPTPDPPPPPTYTGDVIGGIHMLVVMRFGGTPTANWGGWFSPNGGLSRYPVRDMDHAKLIVAMGAIDAKDRTKVTDPNWSDVSHTTSTWEINKFLGPVAA